MRLFVGNLPYGVTEEDVRELFRPHGEVPSVTLIQDRETGKPRGFCFLEMPEPAARRAIAALDGSKVEGRHLRVNEARPRPRDIERY